MMEEIQNMSVLSPEIHQIMKELQREIQAIGEEIWQHPETGYRETRTSHFLAECFSALGLPVRTGLAMTGLRADLDTGRPGPTIALVGELDALYQPGHPAADKKNGAAHSCGHHTHAAAIWGAAAALRRPEVLSQLSGRIVFIAAPAEEGIESDYRRELIKAGKIGSFCGKSQLIREGVFDDVDIALMNHIGTNDYGTNNANGFIAKRITFLGNAAHASYPYRGCNALNAMDLARHAIALLRESASAKDPSARIHGIITSGGSAVNTLPGTVTMEYMLRSSQVNELQDLASRFDQAVRYSAAAMETGIRIESVHGAMPLDNSDALAETARRIIAELAPEAPFHYQTGQDYGSTDMGDVSQLMPVLHLEVRGSNGGLHRDYFALADVVAAYAGNAEILAQMAFVLLSEEAVEARKIIQASPGKMSREEYLKVVDAFSKTIFLPREEVEVKLQNG